MARVNPLLPALNAGEFSPRTEARVDVERYGLGAAVLRNMIPLTQGGAMRRPGTRFVAEVKDSAVKSRLMRFEFNDEQAYAIEAGEKYFRFYRNQGRIVAPDTDAAITNGSFDTGLNVALAHVWQVDDTPSDNAFVDQTANANSATSGDWVLFPATEAVGDYAAFGFAGRFSGLTFDYLNGTAGTGGVVAWEYWDGTAWTALSGVTDATNGFTAAAADGLKVIWTMPADWAARTISTSASLFWVRARITTVYTVNPVLDQGFVNIWVDRSDTGASIAHDAVNDRLSLVGAPPADGGAIARQTVSTSPTGGRPEHALAFDVIGGAVTVRVGSTLGGQELAPDTTFQAGESAAVPYQPADAATSYFVEFRRATVGTGGVDNVRIIENSPGDAIFNGTFISNISGWTSASTGGSSIAWNAGGYMDLIVPVAASSAASAEQAVTTGFPANEHVLVFQVVGAPGDTIELRVGTTPQGAELVEDETLGIGYHSQAFTPGGTFYVQFRNVLNKTVQIDDVRLLDNEPVEIGSPYAAADLFQIKTAQTADVMYLARGGTDYPIYKLGRRGHSSWSLTQVFWSDGPWLDQNEDTKKTLTPSATTSFGITITATGHAPFKATDIGRLIRIQHGANEPGYAIITGFTSDTIVAADVKRDFNAATASDKWRLGAWSGTTGYPKAVGFFEQRLHLANTPNQAQTFWGSQSADFENMRPDSFEGNAVVVEDDDALDYTIAADDVNPILWLSPGQQLVLGTGGGEWLVKSEGAVLTPNDIDVKRQTTHGSADVAPVRVGHVVLFLQKGGRKIREFAFAFDADGYRAPDLTIFADHITRGGVGDIAYQEEPDSNVWCVRKDGVLAALTYKREQNVVGWGRSVIGGTLDGKSAVVESVATIPGNTATGSEDRDEAWVIVKRTIDGAAKRYVEFFEAAYEGPLRDDFASEQEWQDAVLAAQQGAFYVDSGLSYDGPPITSIAGLGHLEGERVKVFADGAVQGDRTVTAGSITLERPGEKIQVGLPYSHRYKSLKLAQGARAGTAVGKKKRVHAVTLLLMDAAEGAFKVGPGREALKAVPLREVRDAMDTAVPLFTGEVFIEFDGDYQRDARIFIEGDDPTPFTLLALAPEMKTNEQA